MARKLKKKLKPGKADFFGTPFGKFPKLRKPTVRRQPRQRNIRASAFGHAEMVLQLTGETGKRKHPAITAHLKSLDQGQIIKWVTDMGTLRAFYRAYARRGARGVTVEDAQRVYEIAQKIMSISRQSQNQIDWKTRAAGGHLER